MAERTIKVRLEAQIDGFKKAMRDASKDSAQLAQNFDRDGNRIDTASGRMVRSAEVNREAWSTSGAALTAFGAAGALALGYSAKAAIDWETAWTGVLKTVDGSAEQLERLQGDLRDMALELPASQTEIAGVAEAAGQLGVKVDDVAEFTRVMIDLGETTNLTADEAATSLARISNIMGTAASDVSRMGATIVDLGNNSATTEREIVELGTRLAAAGKQAGLSEADVFAFASALTSVGVEAEAGGTAMSKVFTSIGDAARDGGEQLEVFAQVAGVSVEEFQRAFEEDAAGAVNMFIGGMGRMASAGESTTDIFESLELTDQRLKRAVLSLGSAQGLLTDQLTLANEAWDSNTALIIEAEKRYDTTEAKLQIAKNAINDAAISFGENLLPIIVDVVEHLAQVAEFFGDLPEPVQKAVVAVTALVTGVSLLGGGFLLLVPRIVATRAAMNELSISTTKFAKVAGKATGVLAVLFASSAIPEWGATGSEGVGEMTAALLEMTKGTKAADTAIGEMLQRGGFKDWFTGNDISSISEAFANLAHPSVGQGIDNVASSVLTLGQSTSTSRLQSQELFSSIDQSLAGLVASGAIDQASDALSAIAEEAGVSRKKVRAFLPEYTNALAGVEAQQELTTASTDDMASAYDDLSGSYVDLNEALSEQIDLQNQLAGIALNERAALSALEQAYDDATDTVKKNGETLDLTTQKGRDNDAALREIASSALDLVNAMDDAGASSEDMQGALAKGRAEFVKSAKAAGLTTAKAEDLADKYHLIPEEIKTVIKADTTQARGALSALRSSYTDSQWTVYVNARNKYADGGAVRGPGTSTSDSIPAMLSNNEHVWSASEVQGAGGHSAVAAMRAAARGGFADGGYFSGGMPVTGTSTATGLGQRMHPADLAEITNAMRVNVFLGPQQVAAASGRGNLLNTALGGI